MISVVVSDQENNVGFILPTEMGQALVSGPRQSRREIQKEIGRMVGLCVQNLAHAPKGDSSGKTSEGTASEEGQASGQEVS